MAKGNRRQQQIKTIEHHLRKYKTYKVGIRNLKRQLDYIMPNMTASYELAEGSSGAFTIHSSTERVAIDRIESRKALNIHEDIERYRLIIESIDEALADLEDIQRDFIKLRYIENHSITYTSIELQCSEKYLFNVRHKAFDKLLISLSSILMLD